MRAKWQGLPSQAAVVEHETCYQRPQDAANPLGLGDGEGYEGCWGIRWDGGKVLVGPGEDHNAVRAHWGWD